MELSLSDDEFLRILDETGKDEPPAVPGARVPPEEWTGWGSVILQCGLQQHPEALALVREAAEVLVEAEAEAKRPRDELLRCPDKLASFMQFQTRYLAVRKRLDEALKGARLAPIGMGASIVGEDKPGAVELVVYTVRWVERRGGIDAVVHGAMTEDILRKVFGHAAEEMLASWRVARVAGAVPVRKEPTAFDPAMAKGVIAGRAPQGLRAEATEAAGAVSPGPPPPPQPQRPASRGVDGPAAPPAAERAAPSAPVQDKAPAPEPGRGQQRPTEPAGGQQRRGDNPSGQPNTAAAVPAAGAVAPPEPQRPDAPGARRGREASGPAAAATGAVQRQDAAAAPGPSGRERPEQRRRRPAVQRPPPEYSDDEDPRSSYCDPASAAAVVQAFHAAAEQARRKYLRQRSLEQQRQLEERLLAQHAAAARREERRAAARNDILGQRARAAAPAAAAAAGAAGDGAARATRGAAGAPEPAVTGAQAAGPAAAAPAAAPAAGVGPAAAVAGPPGAVVTGAAATAEAAAGTQPGAGAAAAGPNGGAAPVQPPARPDPRPHAAPPPAPVQAAAAAEQDPTQQAPKRRRLMPPSLGEQRRDDRKGAAAADGQGGQPVQAAAPPAAAKPPAAAAAGPSGAHPWPKWQKLGELLRSRFADRQRQREQGRQETETGTAAQTAAGPGGGLAPAAGRDSVPAPVNAAAAGVNRPSSPLRQLQGETARQQTQLRSPPQPLAPQGGRSGWRPVASPAREDRPSGVQGAVGGLQKKPLPLRPSFPSAAVNRSPGAAAALAGAAISESTIAVPNPSPAQPPPQAAPPAEERKVHLPMPPTGHANAPAQQPPGLCSATTGPMSVPAADRAGGQAARDYPRVSTADMGTTHTPSKPVVKPLGRQRLPTHVRAAQAAEGLPSQRPSAQAPSRPVAHDSCEAADARARGETLKPNGPAPEAPQLAFVSQGIQTSQALLESVALPAQRPAAAGDRHSIAVQTSQLPPEQLPAAAPPLPQDADDGAAAAVQGGAPDHARVPADGGGGQAATGSQVGTVVGVVPVAEPQRQRGSQRAAKVQRTEASLPQRADGNGRREGPALKSHVQLRQFSDSRPTTGNGGAAPSGQNPAMAASQQAAQPSHVVAPTVPATAAATDPDAETAESGSESEDESAGPPFHPIVQGGLPLEEAAAWLGSSCAPPMVPKPLSNSLDLHNYAVGIRTWPDAAMAVLPILHSTEARKNGRPGCTTSGQGDAAEDASERDSWLPTRLPRLIEQAEDVPRLLAGSRDLRKDVLPPPAALLEKSGQGPSSSLAAGLPEAMQRMRDYETGLATGQQAPGYAGQQDSSEGKAVERLNGDTSTAIPGHGQHQLSSGAPPTGYGTQAQGAASQGPLANLDFGLPAFFTQGFVTQPH